METSELTVEKLMKRGGGTGHSKVTEKGAKSAPLKNLPLTCASQYFKPSAVPDSRLKNLG